MGGAKLLKQSNEVKNYYEDMDVNRRGDSKFELSKSAKPLHFKKYDEAKESNFRFVLLLVPSWNNG